MAAAGRESNRHIVTLYIYMSVIYRYNPWQHALPLRNHVVLSYICVCVSVSPRSRITLLYRVRRV